MIIQEKIKSIIMNPFVFPLFGIALDDITTRIATYNYGNIEGWPPAFFGMLGHGIEKYMNIRTPLAVSLVLGIGTGLYFIDKYVKKNHDDENFRYTHKLFLYPVGVIELAAGLYNSFYLLSQNLR